MFTQLLAFTALVIVLYLVGEYLRLMLLYMTGKKLAKSSLPYCASPARAKHKVIVVGDSTAVGTGAENPKNSIAGRLASLFPNTCVENMGRNGMDTEELARLLASLPARKDYDLAILNIGGNDVVFLSALDDVDKHIESVVREATLRAHKVILWTGGNAATIPAIPIVMRSYYEARSRRLRDDFVRVARKFGVIYIDLFRERKSDPVIQNPNKYVAQDRFHPSDEGYGLWFAELLRVLNENKIELK
ncbi:MAG: hypothetical protein COV07_00355 [Candidatus Vogelbacteria bacterium CG10_big_fil_rev_8_21_14_0_10_45_14]|uniref:SGNH hydrolase-type esterase domain-containing protein n=1 Tax=Candidatus Vogelbacteria bacterium CG10_big_fil_rev_8_21_14_0_10_45_14 TaxID=1975042 RepID=A0A2H0RMA2_9BACT|nr:MAG: hypothetical protein COV07_00355 [Candidatus Vogelbacteria bacterium CG10_big_fil_rev_8_21_14_0_10_45_14]